MSDTQELRELLKGNIIEQCHVLLTHMTKMVIAGRFNVLVCYGPPSIGKTASVKKALTEYAKLVKAEWDAHPIPKPERRTVKDPETGEDHFRGPYVVIQAGISFPVFFCRLYRVSGHGEILFVDDVTSLRDKQIQAMLQQATDPEHNGYCSYNYRAKLPQADVPREYYFKGQIIILTNFDEYNVHESVAPLFTEAMRHRIDAPVRFPWERSPILQYVLIKAVKQRGLMHFLRAPFNPALDKDKQGCGFTGSEAEANKMIDEVGAYMLENINRVGEVGFRFLRDVMKHRVITPNSWREIIDRTRLLPRPVDADTIDPKSPEWAFLERPMR